MPMASLDPTVRAILDQNAEIAPWNAVPIKHARAMFLDAARSSADDAPQLAAVNDLAIPGPAGPLAARLYVPQATLKARPTLLYFHGGGFVLGSLNSHDALCRHLSANSGVQVLSVEYRLAPEHKFPAALDDALAAARWVINNCSAINADPQCLAIGGDSAGANLATTACRLLSSLETPAFRHQTLIYPMTDLTLSQPSHDMFSEGYRLTADILRWFVTSYMRVSDSARDPRLSPLLAENLHVLPPALVLTAGFDPLRDEGLAYAEALKRDGVACEYVCFEDMIHGFCNMPGVVARAREALALVGETVAKALA